MALSFVCTHVCVCLLIGGLMSQQQVSVYEGWMRVCVCTHKNAVHACICDNIIAIVAKNLLFLTDLL